MLVEKKACDRNHMLWIRGQGLFNGEVPRSVVKPHVQLSVGEAKNPRRGICTLHGGGQRRCSQVGRIWSVSPVTMF